LVENGQAGSADFSVAAITAVWRAFLEQELPARLRGAGIDGVSSPSPSRRLRRVVAKLRYR
jgi:hypothetical protein